jgi:hypothetical protein
MLLARHMLLDSGLRIIHNQEGATRFTNFHDLLIDQHSLLLCLLQKQQQKVVLNQSVQSSQYSNGS